MIDGAISSNGSPNNRPLSFGNINELLAAFGLSDLAAKFKQEQIELADLLLADDSALKELIPRVRSLTQLNGIELSCCYCAGWSAFARARLD